MNRNFECFVIFAEMRTGSNFLESNLDLFPGLTCYGEAFNPYFMVTPNTDELFGITVAQRDADPLSLLTRIKDKTDGLPGFRFFHDHDPRVFDALMDDPSCAKVVLTRNIVDAYVSRRIAMATDQWQLNDAANVRKAKARFIPEEFERLFYRMKSFQLMIKERLQRTGQTAFYLDYEDAQDLDVVNGLARFLGETTEISEFAGKFKKQNPEALIDKVQNFQHMASVVDRIDIFDLHKVPNFEPGRAPALKSYIASDALGLIFMPIAGGPTDLVKSWMQKEGEIEQGFSQKTLRQWKRRRKSHRTFTVVRHPVARLHDAFCTLLAPRDNDPRADLKDALRSSYGVDLPQDIDQNWTLLTHRMVFEQFIEFAGKAMGGQTGVAIDPAWASQSVAIQGFANFTLPDAILREDQLEVGLSGLLTELGEKAAPNLPTTSPVAPHPLTDVYTDCIEAAVRKLYQRDYMMFGFGPWSDR
ncbi:nodulation protein NodH [Aliiroseovarius sp. 2305UL8-7]|uniref:nodulation protein NodH n=1 Tax=Aliiroseovarius conchicola TaxID=3121637 RepID=UPI0035286745